MSDTAMTPDERAEKKRAASAAAQRRYYARNLEKCRARNREWKRNNPEKVAAVLQANYQKNRQTRRADAKKYYGLYKETARAWKEQNHDKILATNRRWREKHRDQHNAANSQWQKDNPDKRYAKYLRWAQKYPEKVRAHNAKRRTRETQQEPQWVIHEDIVEVYKQCSLGMHVDHIVPLRGITADGYPVSGLHVPWNLQYLTQSENCQKNNRMRPEDHEAADAPVSPQLHLVFD